VIKQQHARTGQIKAIEALMVGGRRVTALKTLEDCRRMYAAIARAAADTETPIDPRRLEALTKATNGAVTVQNVQATKELAEALLKTEGHGASLLAIQRLKEGPKRRLPRLVKPVPAPESASGSA
jgi:hypothetical protein